MFVISNVIPSQNTRQHCLVLPSALIAEVWQLSQHSALPIVAHSPRTDGKQLTLQAAPRYFYCLLLFHLCLFFELK